MATTPTTAAANGDRSRDELAGATEKDLVIIAAQWRQVQIVREDLALREANLLAYEQHLITWRETIRVARMACVPRPGLSLAPNATAGALAAHEALNPAWDRLKRAEEILEAEQAHLRDDRLQVRDYALSLQQRDAAVAAREAELDQREEALAAAERTATVDDHAAEDAMPGHAVHVARLILRTPRLT